MSYQVIFGWFARVIVVIISFLNTRFLLDILGSDNFAIQSILLSLSGWFALFNLGLPISAQNHVSALKGVGCCYASSVDRSINIAISQTVFLMPIFFVSVSLVCFYFLETYTLASILSITFFCFTMYLLGQGQTLLQILYAENKAIYPNSYPAFIALLNLVVLLLAKIFHISGLYFIIFSLGFSNLIVVFHAFYIVKPKNYQLNISLKLMCKSFLETHRNFIFALFSVMTLSVDYMIMSKVLRYDDIVAYNLVSKIYGLVLVLHNVLLATNWPYLSELTQSGNFSSARKNVHKLLANSAFMACGAGLFIVFIGTDLIEFWIGFVPNSINSTLLLSGFLYVIFRVWCDSYSSALLGCGKVGVIIAFIPIQSLISVFGQYYFGINNGVVGIYIGLIISFFVTAAWILPWSFYKLTKVNETA